MKSKDTVGIALIGCGWWSQGWHLPHLSQNTSDGVKIIALVDPNPHPRSTLNPNLRSLEELSQLYSCPIFSSISDLFQNESILVQLDGVIVCTPHATHYEIGREILTHKKPIPIFMEKPMTTDLQHAQQLHNLVLQSKKFSSFSSPPAPFFINHSANYRPQVLKAKDLIQKHTIGALRHITASFASPLSWLFDDPANIGWNTPSHNMLGNGFAWGQMSHLLAWIYHVTDLCPKTVFCVMTHSKTSGADVAHSATITCENEETTVTMNLSGTCLLPGREHSDEPVGKSISIEVYGEEGSLFYSGNDGDTNSGVLELRKSEVNSGKPEYILPKQGFLFENLDTEGKGPESLQEFIKACQGKDYYVGASSLVGLKTVQTIEAMYRSHHKGTVETI